MVKSSGDPTIEVLEVRSWGRAPIRRVLILGMDSMTGEVFAAAHWGEDMARAMLQRMIQAGRDPRGDSLTVHCAKPDEKACPYEQGGRCLSPVGFSVHVLEYDLPCPHRVPSMRKGKTRKVRSSRVGVGKISVDVGETAGTRIA
jgi:hypothetical protein